MKKEIEEIRKRLFEMADTKYRDFQAGLIPMEEELPIIGVRTPALRSFAKEIKNRPCAEVFLEELPHTYFEENQLHGFLIGLEKDYETCILLLQQFLPYMNNWATCDQTNPKVLKKDPERTRNLAYDWMDSDHTYTKRFGIKVLMDHFLDDAFSPEYLEKVASVESEEYYVRMMIAWYFATALAKQYDAVIPFIEKHRLDPWTHNKAIQKARESFRVEEEHKTYLNTLKVKA